VTCGQQSIVAWLNDPVRLAVADELGGTGRRDGSFVRAEFSPETSSVNWQLYVVLGEILDRHVIDVETPPKQSPRSTIGTSITFSARLLRRMPSVAIDRRKVSRRRASEQLD
jgi:hypothetical protein